MQANAWFCGLAVALIWGAQPVIASFGYRAGLSAADLTMLRFAASGLLMLPLFLRRGVRNAGGLGWQRASALLLLAGPIYNLVLVGGLQWAPASHSSLIYPAFTPLFTALLAKYLLGGRERLPILGLGLLIAGVLAIKLGAILHPDRAISSEAWRGDLLFMLAALMWSLYTVLMRRWQADPLTVVSVVQVGGLLYLPLYFYFAGTSIIRIDASAIAIQTLYLGIVVSVISVFLFNLAVRLIGPKAAMFTALMPVVGVALSVLVLGETLTPALLTGTVLIMAGLFVSLRR